MNKRKQFQLFQTPLDLAHSYWLKLLKRGDIVVDATCGNGHDSLSLAKIVLEKDAGTLISIDTQQQALEKTQSLLQENLSEDLIKRISFCHQCHSVFPKILQKESVALVVYNLGYLPGGNKTLTTESSTTVQSLRAALPLITPGGAISITCYPGHPSGKIEEEAVIQFASSLDPQEWSCCHHCWVNRKSAPSLLFIQHKIT